MANPNFEQLFTRLCERLQVANKVQEISKQFAGTKTDDERVEVAFKHLADLGMLPFNRASQPASTKSATQSVKLRNDGNKVFGKVKPRLRDALTLYTQSVAAAPYPTSEADDSEQLAIAFANRSAVLFAMGKHEDCHKDIDQALLLNYPEGLKYKLLERRGKCFREMRRCDEASQCFLDAMASLPLASLPEHKLKAKMTELQQLQDQSVSSPSKPLMSEVTILPLPQKTYGPHGEVPCASDCIEIKYSRGMGRYIEATKDINPGDIILVEEPYASVLQPQYCFTHCSNCLQRCDALIPCRQCSSVMFCSDNCRNTLWNKSHWFECPLLPSLNKLSMGKIWILALRILVVNFDKSKGIKSLYTKIMDIENMNYDERTKGFDHNGQYVSSDYRTIHHLVGNTEARSVSDLYKRAVKAACILNCIDAFSRMFVDVSSSLNGCSINQSDQPDLKYFVGGLILRLLQTLPCNAHSVADLTSTPGEQIPRCAEFGSAAYATLSLINHSCDPNVSRSNHHGDVGVLFAVRPIRKGDQIVDNYGFHYAIQDVEERLTGLKAQYYFTCQCEACTQNWPLYGNLPTTNPVLKCCTCSSKLTTSLDTKYKPTIIKCAQCSTENNIREVEKRLQTLLESFNKVYNELIESSRCNFMPELSRNLVILDRTVQRPWRLFNDYQESLKECFMRTGNFYIQ